MPTRTVADVELHYEVHGHGPPLCLLTGLGFGIWSWYRQIPALAEHFTVLTIDNRGIGGPKAPPGPFTIADMADDAAALIRALDLAPTHVLGLSLGGFIAQELVLRHPDLVRGLVLSCTNAGLGHYVPASQATLTTIMAEADAGWSEDVLRRGGHLRFTDACLAKRPAFVDELARRRRGQLPARELWDRQIAAAMRFSAGARLAGVRAPTLIMHGGDDPIVAVRNGEILAELIPGAQISISPTGRHLFFIEFADDFNRQIIDFLHKVPD